MHQPRIASTLVLLSSPRVITPVEYVHETVPYRMDELQYHTAIRLLAHLLLGQEVHSIQLQSHSDG